METPSYMVSKDFSFSCEEMIKCIYNAHSVLHLELKKRLLDVTDEEGSARKILKVNPRSRDEFGKDKGLPINPKTYQWCDQSQQGGDQHNPPIAQLDLNSLLNCIAHCSLSDFGSIASTNRIFRSFIKSNELYRLRQANGLVDHWIYFSLGDNEWQAYDPNIDRWLSIPKINSNYVFEHSDKESLAVGNQILVFGMQMHFQRVLFGSASLGEIGIVAGGLTYDGTKILRTAEMYNSETEEWTVIPSLMNKARKKCSSVFMEEKYYVVGGEGMNKNGKEIMLRCGEVYDLQTKKWTLIPNMLPDRGVGDEANYGSPPLVAVAKYQFYAAYYEEREVLKYDKRLNVWTVVGNFPLRTVATQGWGMAFRSFGDQLVVVGGPRLIISGTLEINTCVLRDGELLMWKLLASKREYSYVYNCAIMGY